jgi:hypothetical protein
MSVCKTGCASRWLARLPEVTAVRSRNEVKDPRRGKWHPHSEYVHDAVQSRVSIFPGLFLSSAVLRVPSLVSILGVLGDDVLRISSSLVASFLTTRLESATRFEASIPRLTRALLPASGHETI